MYRQSLAKDRYNYVLQIPNFGMCHLSFLKFGETLKTTHTISSYTICRVFAPFEHDC